MSWTVFLTLVLNRVGAKVQSRSDNWCIDRWIGLDTCFNYSGSPQLLSQSHPPCSLNVEPSSGQNLNPKLPLVIYCPMYECVWMLKAANWAERTVKSLLLPAVYEWERVGECDLSVKCSETPWRVHLQFTIISQSEQQSVRLMLPWGGYKVSAVGVRLGSGWLQVLALAEWPLLHSQVFPRLWACRGVTAAFPLPVSGILLCLGSL